MHGLRPYLEESVELCAVVVVHVVAQLMKGSLENRLVVKEGGDARGRPAT